MIALGSSFLVYVAHYFIARTLYTSLGRGAPTIAVVIALVLGLAWLFRRRRRAR